MVYGCSSSLPESGHVFKSGVLTHGIAVGQHEGASILEKKARLHGFLPALCASRQGGSADAISVLLFHLTIGNKNCSGCHFSAH